MKNRKINIHACCVRVQDFEREIYWHSSQTSVNFYSAKYSYIPVHSILQCYHNEMYVKYHVATANKL
jgi:hypothetical protein